MSQISLFGEKQVRRAWNDKEGKWLFAIVDVIAILTESIDSGAYWRKLKERLKKEGNETVTNCHGLKMTAADGKQRMTDVADTEQLLRLIQSIPSPKHQCASLRRKHLLDRKLRLPTAASSSSHGGTSLLRCTANAKRMKILPVSPPIHPSFIIGTVVLFGKMTFTDHAALSVAATGWCRHAGCGGRVGV